MLPLKEMAEELASHLPKKSGINFLIRRGKKLEDRFIGNAYKADRKILLRNLSGSSAFKSGKVGVAG